MSAPAPVLQYPVGAGGVVTRVLECGSGNAQVLCLHGAGSRADRWRPQLPLLAAAGLHAYAIDFPGHGLADKPLDGDYGARAFADMVEEFVLERLRPEPLVVLGTSLGGQVAAILASRRPDRVLAAVLIGAVGLVARGSDRPRTSPIVDPGPEGTRRKLEFLVHDPTLVTESWVEEETRISSSPGAARALAAVAEYSATRQDDELAADALRRSGVPTLLCWGEQDRWVPLSLGLAARAVLPDADLVTVADTGHAPYFERPQAFLDAITPFLDRVGAGTARSVDAASL